MILKTKIYTTLRASRLQKHFDFIYSTLAKTQGLTLKPFEVIEIELPDSVPTYRDGGVFIDWDWIKKNYPAGDANAVCLNITRKERDRLGLEHPDPNTGLGGVYNNDPDGVFDFVVIADERNKSYGGMTEFQRIFLHELSHGFYHWRGAQDFTHTWDYLMKNMAAPFLSQHDFTRWNWLVQKILELKDILNSMENLVNKLAYPLDGEFMRNVSQPFATPNRAYPLTKHHVGTDWSVPLGEKIYAIAAGVVVRSFNNHPVMGNACEFEFTHAGKIYTARYMHMARPVALGNYKKGDIIGYVGNSGMSSGPHLHLDIYRGVFSLEGVTAANFKEKFVDPLKFIGVA